MVKLQSNVWCRLKSKHNRCLPYVGIEVPSAAYNLRILGTLIDVLSGGMTDISAPVSMRKDFFEMASVRNIRVGEFSCMRVSLERFGWLPGVAGVDEHTWSLASFFVLCQRWRLSILCVMGRILHTSDFCVVRGRSDDDKHMARSIHVHEPSSYSTVGFL